MIRASDNGKVFPDDRMTSRERLLAAYRGEPVDRLPYWAKVTNPTWRTSQPEAVQAWTNRELLDYIHADGILGAGVRPTPSSQRVTRETRRDGNVETRVTHTPDGDLVEKWTFDPTTRSWHPSEFPVKSREDIGRFRWLYADVSYEVTDEARANQADEIAAIGQRGIVLQGCCTTPLMHLVEHVIGPVHTTYMLVDHPREMDELIEQMHQTNLRAVRAIAENTAADVISSCENTSTTLISPQQFERHSYRHLCETGRIIEDAGKMHEMHMCGHTLALLEQIDTIPGSSIEAYTSPTLGNTRLADGRTKAPSKTLVGGTNVNVWLWPIEKIKDYIVAELDACPDSRRIVLTTAGVAPPGCPAEKFREIGEWIPTVPLK